MVQSNEIEQQSPQISFKRKNQASTERSADRLSLGLEVPLVCRGNNYVKNTYHLLHKDISRAEIYEEAWMNGQEAALAQLFNALFNAAEAKEILSGYAAQ